MKYIVTINDNEYIIDVQDDETILVNDELLDADLQNLGEGGLVSLIVNNRSFEAAVQNPGRDQWQVLLGGEIYNIRVQDERAYRLAKARGELDADTGIVPTKAPMPGVVVRVPVEVGEVISKGQTLVILESMKMENELKATRDGVVLEVKVGSGDSVDKDAALVVIGDPPDA